MAAQERLPIVRRVKVKDVLDTKPATPRDEQEHILLKTTSESDWPRTTTDRSVGEN